MQNGLISNLYTEPVADTMLISRPRLRVQKVTSDSCPRQENQDESKEVNYLA